MKIEGSSQLAFVEYDATYKKLKITFHSGHTYEYSDVSATIYTRLSNSESKGTYFRTEIRANPHKYPCKYIGTKSADSGTKASLVKKSEKVNLTDKPTYQSKEQQMEDLLKLSSQFHQIMKQSRD